MPELPEVQTTVNGLNLKVLNRTFIDVWSDWEKLVKIPKDFKVFKKELKGKKILRVWRRAKNVILELSGGYSLLIHMKMTGHLMVGKWTLGKPFGAAQGRWVPIKKGPLEEKINSFLHIIFFLDNGEMIALSDVRKFAKIELWKTQEMLNSKEFKRIGPEPLEKSFTFKNFESIFKNKKGKIKQIIMDPNVIAGVGNIYASEALWWSKIHPETRAEKLKEKELKLLYTAIKKVLLAGIEFGGDSFSDYRDVNGEKGKFESKKMVYKREGEKCSRCKTLIKRIMVAQRSSFFCQQCQAL